MVAFRKKAFTASIDTVVHLKVFVVVAGETVTKFVTVTAGVGTVADWTGFTGGSNWPGPSKEAEADQSPVGPGAPKQHALEETFDHPRRCGWLC